MPLTKDKQGEDGGYVHAGSFTSLPGTAELQDLNSPHKLPPHLWLVPGAPPGRELLKAQLQRGTIHVTACVNVLYDLPGGLSLSFSLFLTHTPLLTCLSFSLHISLCFLDHSGQRCFLLLLLLLLSPLFFFLKLWSSSLFILLRPSCYSWSWLCLSVLSALGRQR